MTITPTLNSKLKKCDPEIQEYVKALRSENAKLQRRIAKLEVDNFSLNNRVKAAEKDFRDNRPIIHYIAELPERKSKD